MAVLRNVNHLELVLNAVLIINVISQAPLHRLIMHGVDLKLL